MDGVFPSPGGRGGGEDLDIDLVITIVYSKKHTFPLVTMSALGDLTSLQQDCLSAYGDEGPQGVEAFKHCRGLLDQWMQKARADMVMYTEMRGVHTGRQTYSQTTGAPIRDGTNALTDMDDMAIEESAESLQYARNLRGDM